MARIFLSHTSEMRSFPAGGSFVAAVERAVSAAGHTIVDMADFPAADRPPAGLCADRVRGADVYLAILGTRYGSLLPEGEVSYTEFEFDVASEAGLPRLVFLLETDRVVDGLPPAALVDHEFGGRQQRFRDRALNAGLTAQKFTTPHQLGALAERSLRDLSGTQSRVDNLPAATRVFEGRDLTALATPDARPVVVHGLGGIGKTELAIHYARERRDQHRVVWWITADNATNVGLGLAALTGRLQPPGTLADAQAWAITWLQNNPGWLLILDNVEDFAHVEPLLGQVADRGRVLITTRWNLGAARWARLGLVPVPLDVLDRDASVRLLTRLTGLPDADGADRLATELGELPLALDQAAAYLSQHDGLTFDGYRRLLDTRFDRVAADPGAGGDPERAVAPVLRMSIDAIEERTPLAGRLLRVIAWLAPEALPSDVLLPLADDELDLADALAALSAYSLVTSSAGRVSVHRLVQAATRAGDPAEAVELLHAALPPDPANDVTGWPRWNDLLPHVDALLGRFDTEHENTLVLEICHQAARYRQAQGHLDAAIAGFRQAADGRTRVLGPDDESTLRSRHDLAHVLQSAGALDESRKLHEEVLARRRGVLGPDHPDTLTSRNSLAYTLRQTGLVDDAIAGYREVVEARARVLGPDHPDTLMTRNNLAYAYRVSGRVDESIALFEELIPVRQRVLGARHLDSIHSQDSLAGSYRNAGRLDAALRLFEEVAAARSEVLGERHPLTLKTLNGLAGAHLELGRSDVALTIYEQLVADARATIGDDHPSTLLFRHNLAYAYRVTGNAGRAIEMFEEIVAVRRRILGADHPSATSSIQNLATAYRAVGRVEEAITLTDEVIESRSRISGDDHPRTLRSRHSQALNLLAVRRVPEAVDVLRQIIAGQRRISGAHHPRTLRFRYTLARAHRIAGRLEQAAAGFRAVLADRQRILGDDHPETRSAAHALRKVQARIKQRGQSRP